MSVTIITSDNKSVSIPESTVKLCLTIQGVVLEKPEANEYPLNISEEVFRRVLRWIEERDKFVWGTLKDVCDMLEACEYLRCAEMTDAGTTEFASRFVGVDPSEYHIVFGVEKRNITDEERERCAKDFPEFF